MLPVRIRMDGEVYLNDCGSDRTNCRRGVGRHSGSGFVSSTPFLLESGSKN